MIPARMGSQRLLKKNLHKFNGIPLIEHAIIRCKNCNIFDEIYINSEAIEFKAFADKHNINFYKRPNELGNNLATSEEFVEDFFLKIECEMVYQIHTITPLISSQRIIEFDNFCNNNNHFDTVLSGIEDQIEVMYKYKPVNFSFNKKTNSQDLIPTQKITWPLTKWTRNVFLKAKQDMGIGTYSGNIGFFPVNFFEGFPIKNDKDLMIANVLEPFI